MSHQCQGKPSGAKFPYWSILTPVSYCAINFCVEALIHRPRLVARSPLEGSLWVANCETDHGAGFKINPWCSIFSKMQTGSGNHWVWVRKSFIVHNRLYDQVRSIKYQCTLQFPNNQRGNPYPASQSDQLWSFFAVARWRMPYKFDRDIL